MSNTNHHIPELVAELKRGSRRALARAISLVESSAPNDVLAAAELMEHVGSSVVPTRRIGVTGSPGVGKSTLLEALGMHLIARGEKVAVLAIDPSSKRSGGSILGDKVRMPRLSQSDSAFVRPSPSKNILGGAAAHTRDSITLCEVAGYSTVIVETVGVGQSETQVSELVDMFVLLLLPTAGDDVQGMKRGIMEQAHMILLTKADIDTSATNAALATFRSVVRLVLPPRKSMPVLVLPVSATTQVGLDEVVQAIDTFFLPEHWSETRLLRKQQLGAWFDSEVQRSILNFFDGNQQFAEVRDSLKRKVMAGSVSAGSALRELYASLPHTIRG